MKESNPLQTPEQFKTLAPFVVIDLSYQNEEVKMSPVDKRVSIELSASSQSFFFFFIFFPIERVYICQLI